jgi:hypothetical protein
MLGLVAYHTCLPKCYNSTPHFSTFFTHMTSHALSSHTMHLSCASKSWDLSLLILHLHALFYLPMFLFGSSRLCHNFLLHSSNLFVSDSLTPPLVLIHHPHLVYFLIPVHVTDTSCFTSIRSLMLLSLILYYT